MADETTAPAVDLNVFDAETQGYITTRGLDKKPLHEALQLTIQAHRNAEKVIGAPADQMIRWPGESDADGWKAIHKRMGVPDDATGYKFEGVKDEAFAMFMRQAAMEAKLPPSAAEKLAQGFQGFNEQVRGKEENEAKLKAALANDELRMSWGASFEQNKFIAERAANLLGLTPDVLNDLANRASYGKVMEGLRQVGVKMGEATLLGLDNPRSPNGPMTKEEALSRKESLVNDTDFVKRWMKGDSKAVKELQDLDRIALGMKPLGGY